MQEKGELAGYAFGKHGADILAPGAVAKIASKSAKSAQELTVVFENLKRAETTLVLETAAAGIGNSEKIRTTVQELNQLNKSNVTGFVGAKGRELKNPHFQPTKHNLTQINGRTFRGHALNQMQNRGITPSVVENAIKHGEATQANQATGVIIYYDKINKIKVVVNNLNEVVTVIPVKRGS